MDEDVSSFKDSCLSMSLESSNDERMKLGSELQGSIEFQSANKLKEDRKS